MAFGDPGWMRKWDVRKSVLPKEVCKIEGCKHIASVHGYCWWHKGYAYKDRAWAKGIKPRGEGTRKTGDKNMELWGFSSQIDLFKHLWETREHRSYLSDEPLDKYSSEWLSLFAHVLAKKNYPLYKCNPKNIVLLTPFEHNLFDQGTVEQMEVYCRGKGCLQRWGQLLSLREAMKREYAELVKNK